MASLLVLFAAAQLMFTGLVQAVVQDSLSTVTKRDNVVFTDDVLFEEQGVRSDVDCARHCTNIKCRAFTFTAETGVCRGYLKNINPSSSDTEHASGAKTYNIDMNECASFPCQNGGMCMDLVGAYACSCPAAYTGINCETRQGTGPCAEGNHTVLDDPRRDVNNAGGDLCDNGLTLHGWYRFKLNGTNAVLPTACLPINRCGTGTPIWIDLKGSQMPAAIDEELTTANLCGNAENVCCRWPTPTIVRNCGHFFLFQLVPTSLCPDAFCAEIATL